MDRVLLTDVDPNDNKLCRHHKTCSGVTSRSSYCSSCLFTIWGLGIGPSLIIDREGKQAGLGLFALRSFKQRELICFYSGRKVSHHKVKTDNFYAMALQGNYSIDGQNPYSCIGRYINGSSAALNIEANAQPRLYKEGKKRKTDVAFDYTNINTSEPVLCKNSNNIDSTHRTHRKACRPFKDDSHLGIYATRDIKEGEEIFITYGASYWAANRRAAKWAELQKGHQEEKQRLPAQPNFKKQRFTRSDIV
jgi:SET domain-containing protein